MQPTIFVMPLPRALARFNRRVTNRVLGPLAHVIPPFAEVEHRGRKSGRTHRTPVWAFPTERGYVIALTYGPDVEWLKNLQASGRGQLETLGQTWMVSEPRVFHDEQRAAMPQPVRFFLGLIKAHDFVELRRSR